MINIYIVYEINLCSNIQGASLAIGALKLTKNAEPDKYNYSGYCSVFNSRESFLLSNGSDFGKNVIIFGDDMSSWGYVLIIKRKIFWFLVKAQQMVQMILRWLQGDNILKILLSNRKKSLRLHYNEMTSYIFFNDVDLYKFEAKDSEINSAPLCLSNASQKKFG